MSVFGDAEFVAEVRKHFICVAVNQHHHRRRKDLEREIFAKLVHQTGEKVNGYNQGLYFFTPDAKLLSFSNTVSGKHAWKLLRKALDAFTPAEDAPDSLKGRTAGPLWTPPEGTVVVRVTSKVLGGYEEPDRPNRKIQQESLGRDTLWVSREEASELVAGRLPASLKAKLPRFLIDNTRGEPGGWRREEIRSFELTLKNGRLTGSAHLERKSGDVGYRTKLLGIVEAKEGALRRFDLIAKGDYWGEGRYARNAPKGRFPFAVAFTIFDGNGAADQAPPGAK